MRGGSCPSPEPRHESLFTLTDIVDDYIARHRDNAREELRWFEQRHSLEQAIRCAATAMRDGAKLRHQWRLQNRVLTAFATKLNERIGDIRNARNFESLYQIVDEESIKGIGSLTIYDTAHRIGVCRKLRPSIVYLHAGTRQGARLLGFRKCDTLTVRELPEPLWRLTPAEIEDCLCLYKTVFARIAPDHVAS